MTKQLNLNDFKDELISNSNENEKLQQDLYLKVLISKFDDVINKLNQITDYQQDRQMTADLLMDFDQELWKTLDSINIKNNLDEIYKKVVQTFSETSQEINNFVGSLFKFEGSSNINRYMTNASDLSQKMFVYFSVAKDEYQLSSYWFNYDNYVKDFLNKFHVYMRKINTNYGKKSLKFRVLLKELHSSIKSESDFIYVRNVVTKILKNIKGVIEVPNNHLVGLNLFEDIDLYKTNDKFYLKFTINNQLLFNKNYKYPIFILGDLNV